LLVNGKGKKFSRPKEAVISAYNNALTDEYIEPAVILPQARIKNNDAVIFFNLRSDRARQFSKLFVLSKSSETNLPQPRLKNLYFVAMTNFGPDLPVHTAFQDHPINGTLPTALAKFSQLYIAETEKFAHITYFLNGGYADALNGEDRLMVPSPITKNYSQIPQMSAGKITQKVLTFLKRKKYDFIAINFANADMVGHTGDMKAAIKAVEWVDKCLGKIYQELQTQNGRLIITADHGNADCMWDRKMNLPMTFHTKNPVPFIIASKEFKGKKLSTNGVLGNIAPTICAIMGVEKLKEMKKRSLL
jgi:2,3-bisphosphoglycerate-independent phosphoglycerate mutase